jgi:hypothetical protein
MIESEIPAMLSIQECVLNLEKIYCEPKKREASGNLPSSGTQADPASSRDESVQASMIDIISSDETRSLSSLPKFSACSLFLAWVTTKWL